MNTITINYPKIKGAKKLTLFINDTAITDITPETSNTMEVEDGAYKIVIKNHMGKISKTEEIEVSNNSNFHFDIIKNDDYLREHFSYVIPILTIAIAIAIFAILNTDPTNSSAMRSIKYAVIFGASFIMTKVPNNKFKLKRQYD